MTEWRKAPARTATARARRPPPRPRPAGGPDRHAGAVEKLPVVTIFGSSRAERDGPEYREAYQLGKLLAEGGYVVCNGGYSGTMEAASRGCKDAGGRTIGVTVDVFGGLAANEFLDEEVGTASLLMRLDKLTALADAFIALGGGIGTLLEMALVWNLCVMQVYPEKPIVLLGAAWKEVVDCFSRQLLIRDIDVAAFTFAEKPEDALLALERERSTPTQAPDWRG
jgi:uncharacterized protein (TIGR00725 family)